MFSRPVSQRMMIPNAFDDARRDRFRGVLGQAPIFRGLSSHALDDLVARLQVRTRAAGAILVAQDDPGDALFVIFSGRVKVALFADNGREVTLATLGPGEFFGEMSLFDGRPRSASVVALDDTTVLTLTRDAFFEHLRQQPQTAVNLLGEMTRRLRRADETIADLALHDVHARLVRTLERLARDGGEETAEGLVLRRRPTQQELANMVGACRETISRAFTALVGKGLLQARGRSLFISRRLYAPSAA